MNVVAYPELGLKSLSRCNSKTPKKCLSKDVFWRKIGHIARGTRFPHQHGKRAQFPRWWGKRESLSPQRLLVLFHLFLSPIVQAKLLSQPNCITIPKTWCVSAHIGILAKEIGMAWHQTSALSCSMAFGPLSCTVGVKIPKVFGAIRQGPVDATPIPALKQHSINLFHDHIQYKYPVHLLL
jgi:hypothetical protein